MGPRGGGRLLQLHKVSFIVWVGALGVHVLVYALRAGRLLRADWLGEPTPGRVLRNGILAGALVSGLILALAALPLDDSWLDSVRNLVTLGASVAAALSAASEIPARIAGRTEIGSLHPGARADVVVLDDSLQIVRVLVDGDDAD